MDGTNTCAAPLFAVSNVKGGRVGLWLDQDGNRQEYDHFEVSRGQFAPPKRAPQKPPQVFMWPGGTTPKVPWPQDWVLVLEQVKQN